MSILVALLLLSWIGGIIGCYTIKNPVTQRVLFIVPALLSLCAAIGIAWLIFPNEPTSLIWKWFNIGNTVIYLTFEFNKYTIPLMVLVCSISFLVHLYSIDYMKHDASKTRFFATLAVFTFAMLGLTISGNLLQLFMFWELVGLCSYLLIGFYRDSTKANHASMKALIINKVGDAGFLLALMALWATTQTFEINQLSTNIVGNQWQTFIGIAILIAACAKSAQFPFHTWLPDAMIGPTPVSALIHSATMVAAGVFLLVRLQFLFTPFVLQAITVVGAATALIGGINAIRENDLKRFLAWSTLSQLGLMFLVVGNSASNAAFIHLLSHAVFKAGLFLVAGVLIQHYNLKYLNEQGATSKVFRILTFMLVLSLVGMPFTIGFLSKEAMLATVGPGSNTFILALSFITAFYSTRLLMFVQAPSKSNNGPAIPLPLLVSVLVLALASVWIFYARSPLSADWTTDVFHLSAPSTTVTWLSVGVTFFGMAIAIVLIKQGKMVAIQKLIPIVAFDTWLKFLLVKPVLELSQGAARTDHQIDRGIHLAVYIKVSIAFLVSWIDQYVVDGFVQTLVWISKSTGNIFRKLVTGKIQDYIWWTVIGLILVIIVLSR